MVQIPAVIVAGVICVWLGAQAVRAVDHGVKKAGTKIAHVLHIKK